MISHCVRVIASCTGLFFCWGFLGLFFCVHVFLFLMGVFVVVVFENMEW